jgi:hypothetical protein
MKLIDSDIENNHHRFYYMVPFREYTFQPFGPLSDIIDAIVSEDVKKSVGECFGGAFMRNGYLFSKVNHVSTQLNATHTWTGNVLPNNERVVAAISAALRWKRLTSR